MKIYELKKLETKNFYDDLSDDYHLIFENWDQSMQWQSDILDKIIKQHASRPIESVYDCSCGIGTQAIGLALKGYRVHATDLSPKAVKRAEIEASKRSVALMTFGVADFTKLEEVDGTYDIVISCDNSLPHLLDDEGIQMAAKGIRDKLNIGGLFIGSIRDYDALLKKKPSSTEPRVKDYEELRTISFQVWDWHDNNIYTVNHFTLKGSGDDFDTYTRQAQYRAYKRNELTDLFIKAGFTEVEWLMPEVTSYYQPIIMAKKV